MKITNKSPALQGVNTTDGQIVFIPPGETRDLDVSTAEMTTLQKHRFLQFGEPPVEEGGEGAGDGDELARERAEFDRFRSAVDGEMEQLRAEVERRGMRNRELQQNLDDATKELEQLRAAQQAGQGSPATPRFLGVKEKAAGWFVIVDASGNEVTKSLRKDAVEGFDAKSDEDKAAFVAANQAD